MSETFAVDTTARSIASSPASHATVSVGVGTIYYSRERTVSSTSYEGSLTVGQSATFTNGPRWLVSNSTGARAFVTYSPEATTDMATQAELDAATTDIAVVKEGPINVEYPEYGADGTGTTDSSAAFEAAITAAKTAVGGSIFAPRRYKIEQSGAINLDSAKSITIFGENGMTGGALPRSYIEFTQSSGALISARSASGIVLRDFCVRPGNASWEGDAIDFGKVEAGSQNTYSRLDHMNLYQSGGKGTGLRCANTAGLDVIGCRISGFNYGVWGESEESDNSVGITFLGGLLVGNKSMNVVNGGESWSFLGTTVECLSSGKAGFLEVKEGYVPRNFKIDGVWMGDANAEGTWIVWRGFHFTATNSTFGGGAIGLHIPEDITKANHVTVNGGCRFVGVDGIRANWSGGGGEYAYDIGPNNYGALSGKKISLDNGSSDLGAARTMNGTNLRFGGSNTTKVGFFGKAPAVRPNVAAAGSVTAKELCEALETLGLIE